MPITLEARRSFVRQCTALSIWLARRLTLEGKTLRHALTTCTNVYRFTTLWDGKHHPAEPPPGWRDDPWESLLDQIDRLDAKYPAGDAPPPMEAEAVDLFWPRMEGRIAGDVAAWPKVSDKPFGFFNYHAGDEGWAKGTVNLHLNNPFAPASPLDDLARRAGELAALLRHAQSQNPALHIVSLQSWLAAVPPLQSLFPPEFAASASAPSRLAYHYGWWGQMIDRTGGFHERNARHLRDHGQFRYPCITCACPIEAALIHLREHFAVEE